MSSTGIRSLTRSPGCEDFQNFMTKLNNPEEQYAEPPFDFDQAITNTSEKPLSRTPSPFSPDDSEKPDSFIPSLQALERRV